MGWLFAFGAICALTYFVAPKRRSRIKSGSGVQGYQLDPLAHLGPSRKTNSIRDAAPVDAGDSPENTPWDFEISYREESGEVAVHRIRLISFNGESDPLLTAISNKTGVERRFRASRVEMCANLHSGRSIRDLGTYLRKGYGWR